MHVLVKCNEQKLKHASHDLCCHVSFVRERCLFLAPDCRVAAVFLQTFLVTLLRTAKGNVQVI